MSKSRDHPDMTTESYLSDNSSGSGLDVFCHQHNTAPPPNLAHDGQSGKDQEAIWSYYTQRREQYDKDIVGDANKTVDLLLVFNGFFSAVATVFMSQTNAMLRPDLKDFLTSIYMQIRTPGISTTINGNFVAPKYVVRVNCFLLAGLFTSMLVALLEILVKQWTRRYQREVAGVSSPHLRAFNGAKRWHLAIIVGLLSTFMHLALFISAVGIINLLVATAPTIGYVALSVFLLGASFLVLTMVLPLFVLDAPFRSPVSKFLSGMKRQLGQIQAPAYRSDMGKRRDLENGPDASQPQVTGANEPHASHSRDIILEVYNFLTQGCIKTNEKGEEELHKGRLPRAINLCRFLAWYLALPATPEERGQLSYNLNKGGDPTILAKLLAQEDHIPSVIAATTVLSRIEHFKQPGEYKECAVCRDETVAITKVDPDAEPSESRGEKKLKAITSLLIKRTDCLCTKTEPLEKMTRECADSLAVLQTALQNCNLIGTDRKLWMQILAEKETGASMSVKEAWFDPLRTTLNGLQIKRGSSPFRPGDATSSSGSNGTIPQPLRLQLNSQPQRERLSFQQRLFASSGHNSNGSATTSPTPSSLRPTPSPLSSPNYLSP